MTWPAVAMPGSVADVAHVAESRDDAGDHVLDAVERFLSRFVAYPSDAARVAAVLWTAHTHLVDCFESTPRLAHLSPEPGSGKTRALEALELLVPRPLHAVNATPAALFRKVSDEAGPPTILFDEIDTLFGPKAKDNEDVRGMLNAGHRRGATALRCVVRGKEVSVEEFPAYCAVALAGLGDLPDTVMTRSVVIRMRRRAPGERVEPFRHRQHSTAGHALRDRLAEWCESVRYDMEDAWPDMPEGIEDRNADVWEPLLAVADAAGPDWPERARVAAVALVAQSQEKAPTLGIQLLADLRQVFTTDGGEHIGSDDLLSALHQLDESPWADLRGKPLDFRGLSRRLTQYGVKSRNVRVGEKVVKGYSRTDLHDPWERYLPPSVLSGDSATSATSATALAEPGLLLPVPDSATSATAQQAAPDVDTSAPSAHVLERFAALIPPEQRGPCVSCGGTTRRYGPDANPRCGFCQEVA
jgi:hypothetical protein